MADTLHSPPTVTPEDSPTNLLTPENSFVIHANTTPPRTKVAAYEIFEGTSPSLKTTRQRLLNETSGHFQGPIPVSQFFDAFMPWNECLDPLHRDKLPAATRLTKISTLPKCAEAQSYGQLIDAFEECSTLRVPAALSKTVAGQLRFVDSHLHRDRDCSLLGVDISIYSGRNFIPRLKDTKMDFANLHSWIELKPTKDYDPFDDTSYTKPGEGVEQGESKTTAESDEPENGTEGGEREDEDVLKEDNREDKELDVAAENEHRPRCEQISETRNKMEKHDVNNLSADRTAPPFERNTARACETRAQLSSYAGATFATQYRTHLFSVIIAGDIARFIRWDRASAIVTEAINIVDNPILLFKFFRRFRQLTLEQRGTIPHVRPALKNEADLARRLLKNIAPELWLGTAGYLFLKTYAIDIDTQPFVKVTYDHQVFIVPAPHCLERGLSPFGRDARASAAVLLGDDEDTASVCFLKDSWRDVHRESEPEIYRQLDSANVPNVAKMICGGDWHSLAEHRPYTTLGAFMKGGWGKQEDTNPIRNLRGCLIALNVVGRPLVAFRKAHQLIGALADATEGESPYEEALSRIKVMHRDISPYNILIVKDSSGKGTKGLLIDWDHATKIDSADQRGTWRTGTWQFMSINLLRGPTPGTAMSHSAMDDRESVFYVLLWTSLRYLKHGLDPESLYNIMDAFDQRDILPRGGTWVPVGGEHKRFYLEQIITRDGYLEFEVEGLTDIIGVLADGVNSRYHPPPSKYNQTIKPAEWKVQQDANLNKSINNPNWLKDKLRKLHDDLKTAKDANNDKDDWFDNTEVTKKLWVPAAVGKGVQQSQYHAAYSSSSRKRLTREDNEPDQPSAAKRSKSNQ